MFKFFEKIRWATLITVRSIEKYAVKGASLGSVITAFPFYILGKIRDRVDPRGSSLILNFLQVVCVIPFILCAAPGAIAGFCVGALMGCIMGIHKTRQRRFVPYEESAALLQKMDGNADFTEEDKQAVITRIVNDPKFANPKLHSSSANLIDTLNDPRKPVDLIKVPFLKTYMQFSKPTFLVSGLGGRNGSRKYHAILNAIKAQIELKSLIPATEKAQARMKNNLFSQMKNIQALCENFNRQKKPATKVLTERTPLLSESRIEVSEEKSKDNNIIDFKFTN